MSLPFDSSDPAIRLALKHVRLQALTPMAILMNLVAFVVCAAVLDPSAKRIQEIYATPFSTDPTMLGLYWLGTFVMLIGYCVILMIARKTDTKETLVNGVGLRLVFIQWILGFEFLAFTLQWFKTALVLVSLALALLIWVHISLYLYPTAPSRPLDTVFIHAPLRLLLVVTLLQDFPQILFIVVGWTWNQLREIENYDRWAWQGVAFIVSFNLIGVLEVGWRLDFLWAVGGMWLALAQLLHRPKAAPVYGALVAFVILYPVVLIAMTVIWNRRERARQRLQEGRIRLPEDEVEVNGEVGVGSA